MFYFLKLFTNSPVDGHLDCFQFFCYYKQRCYQHSCTLMGSSGWVGPGFGKDGWCIPQISRNIEAMHGIRQVQGMTQDQGRPAQSALIWEIVLYNQPVEFPTSSVQLLRLSIITLGRQRMSRKLSLLPVSSICLNFFEKKNMTVGWCLRLDSLAKTLRQRTTWRRFIGTYSQEMNLSKKLKARFRRGKS